MTLCDALDWCRANRVSVQFYPDQCTVNLRYGNVSFNAATLEAAVELAVADGAKPGETVAEAAKRGFHGG